MLDLAVGTDHRKLWDSLPLNTFVDMSKLTSFGLKGSCIACRIRQSFPSFETKFDPVGHLPFGQLYLNTCGGVVVAYFVSAPRCSTFMRPNFFRMRLRECNDKREAVYTDKTLVIMANSFSMVAAIPSKRWII